MTDILNDVKNWCEEQLPERTIRDLDTGREIGLDLYRDFAGRGWLSYADIFQDKANLNTQLEIGKIVSGYSSVVSNLIGVNSICSMLMTTFGNDAQKALGRRVLNGEILTCFSLTEPEAGSDIQNVQSMATVADDQWIINGEKVMASGAAIADYMIIVARTSTDKPMNQDVSLFLVPADSKGLKITPQPKIATRAFASCRIEMESVTLPSDAIIGGPGLGWGALVFAGAIERLMVAASCVGLSKKMVSYIYDYSQKRIIQGKPLIDIQLINHQLADLTIKIQAADLLVKNAVDLLAAGGTPTTEICGAKVFASEMQQEVSSAAMRIMGGRAYLEEYPVERWVRENLLSLYAGGTNELQKNIIVRKLHQVLV